MENVKKESYFGLKNWRRTVATVLTGDVEHPGDVDEPVPLGNPDLSGDL